jgi:hypothetical protein
MAVTWTEEIKQHFYPQIPRQFSISRLTTRTKRVAAKSIAAIPAESIPIIGVAVLIADTGYELYAACETARDLDQLYADLGMEDVLPNDSMHSVCDPELPEAGEFGVGLLPKAASGWIWPGRLCSR